MKSLGRRLTPWLRMATLVLVMLATIGAWEVYRATFGSRNAAHAGLVFDHFTCYQITPAGPSVNQSVILTDQFNPKGKQVTVLVRQQLCVPTAKTHLP